MQENRWELSMEEHIWEAIVQCDDRYDGEFYYGLKTTGIYCRPSCKSRTPNRMNVAVFATAQEAEAYGLRACKRCRPEQFGDYSVVLELAGRALRLIEERYAEDLTLKEMSQRLFVSPFHLQRSFSRSHGCSPAKYVTRCRIEAAKRLLLSTDLPVTDIALQTGFRTPSYFADQFRKDTRCTPTLYRKMFGPALTEGSTSTISS